MWSLVLCAAAGVGAVIGCAIPRGGVSSDTDPDAPQWIQLFNGRDLDDWVPKFVGRPLGENYLGTFRADSGLLMVRYDDWTAWDGAFGHLFYKRRPFSYYVVAVEYRFVGRQVAGAGDKLAWAVRNNGVMVHASAPETMGLHQDFPVSLEVQLLGGLGDGRARPTGNVCTPGTHVVMGDTLVVRHCVNSASRTFDGDQWVRVEALVLADSIIKHIVNGDTVLVYERPTLGGGAAHDVKPGIIRAGEPLAAGYIAIQAETAPIDFRRMELLNLEGCTDQESLTYKRYFVKSDSTACFYAAPPSAPRPRPDSRRDGASMLRPSRHP